MPISVKDKYDVIVAGGGPAGMGAALGAAQTGAKVLLVEGRGYLGGVATVSPWMPINRMLLNGKTRGGVHSIIMEELEKLGPAAYRSGKSDMINGDGLNCHPDYWEMALYNALEKLGVAYLLNAPVTGVLKSANRVTGVRINEKTGIREIKASAVIDATGDGDVAAAAGVSFSEGREEDGRHMPVTLGFALGGLDEDVFLEWWRSPDSEGSQKDKGQALLDSAEKEGCAVPQWIAFDRGTVPGTLGCNNGGLKNAPNLNGLDPSHLTFARRMGLQIALDLVKTLKDKKVPGAENVFLLRTGAALGIRDTRRMDGEYALTLEDAEKGTPFEDYVARKYGAVDANQLYIGTMKSGFGYPYRSMIPREIDGLLLAGRCGSATFLGHAAGKSMGNMMDLGQAAGTAAALAAGNNKSVRDITAGEIREALMDRDISLDQP